MRRMIPTKYMDWIGSLLDYVVQNGSTTEIGGNLEVDGNLVLNSADNIVDTDGNELAFYTDIDISSVLSFYTTLSDISSDISYARIRTTKDGQLYLVVNFSLTNSSESSVELGKSIYYYLSLADYTDIAEAIYDVNGDTVADAVSTSAGITSVYGFTDFGTPANGYYLSRIFVLVNLATAYQLRIQMRDGGTIPASTTWNFTMRVFLTL